jgi:hypothetical protein
MRDHWRLLFLLLIAAIAGCHGPVPQFAGGGLAPLDTDGGRLVVSARLDGKPYRMVLDTGASVTSISTAAARELGIKVVGTTQINDHIPAKLGVLRSLSIGVVEHADVTVVIVDMPNARDSAVAFQGILGLDVLSHHDVVLDFGRRTLALYPAGTPVLRRRDASMARIEFQRGSHGLLVFQIVFRGRPPIPAILDLGAPTSVINGAAAAALGVRRPAFRPPPLELGGVELGTPYMLIRDLPVFARFGLADRPAILLGSDVFKDRALVIAYRDRVAFLSR